MQQQITIKYSSGDSATYVAYPPDYAKWERETKKSISEFNGIWDILYVAYSAMKRDERGAVKPFNIWMESIIDIEMVQDDPKASQEEV